MNKRFPSINYEALFFYSCLGVSLVVILLNPTNPTLDGPAHLYNANLVKYLIGGNQFISKYYTLNRVPAANFTDHYLLAFFMSVFSWQVAEKLLFLLYLLGFTLLFRSLIKQWRPSNIGLSILAIPFAFPFLYYIGFYNYCLSFPLLFGILVYHHKIFYNQTGEPALKNYVILCLLATLIYFTNGLSFLFAGLALFLFEGPIWLRLLKQGIPIVWKRLLLFSLVWMPGIICFLVFLCKVHIDSSNDRLSFSELTQWIYHMQPLVVFASGESNITCYLFYPVFISLVTAIYFRLRQKNEMRFNQSDVFLLLSAIACLCFFIVPNGASVGMMTTRLCNYFFIFLLFWIAMQKGSKIITWMVSFVVIAIHFTLLFTLHQPVIADLNSELKNVREAGGSIKPNSIVLNIDLTGNWLLNHFPDYLGVDKPLVILGNYEANDGWFAITWNNGTIPHIQLDGKDSIPPFFNEHWKPSGETKAIDYVFVYGNYEDLLQKQDWKTLNEILVKDYKLVYNSPDKRIHVFSLAGK